MITWPMGNYLSIIFGPKMVCHEKQLRTPAIISAPRALARILKLPVQNGPDGLKLYRMVQNGHGTQTSES